MNLNYIGTSKKSQIFRSKKFKEVQFNIHNPIYDKEMNKIGHIKDIFGPVDKPFVSIQLDNNKNHADFDFYSEFLYIKTKKSKN